MIFTNSTRSTSVAKFWRLVATACCAILSGCSGNDSPKLYPVTGEVLLDGEPLRDAMIVLHSEDGDQRRLTARTDDLGKFEITSFAKGDGAPAGNYGVTVEYRELIQEGEETMRVGRHLLPARYLDPQTSGLHCQVKPGVDEPLKFQVSKR